MGHLAEGHYNNELQKTAPSEPQQDNTRDEGHAPRPAAEAKETKRGGRHGTSRPLLQSNAGEAEDANRIGRPLHQRQRRGIGSAIRNDVPGPLGVFVAR